MTESPAPLPLIEPGRSAEAVLLVHSNTVLGSFGAEQLKHPVSIVHIAGSIVLKFVEYAVARALACAAPATSNSDAGMHSVAFAVVTVPSDQ